MSLWPAHAEGFGGGEGIMVELKGGDWKEEDVGGSWNKICVCLGELILKAVLYIDNTKNCFPVHQSESFLVTGL